MPSSKRWVSDTSAIEWALVGDDVLEEALQDRHLIKSLYGNATGTKPIESMFYKIERSYINQKLATANGINTKRRFFPEAVGHKDPRKIITACTAETNFYRILNTELISGCCN